MSPELLLLLIAFVVLPLIQQLLRVRSQRLERAPDRSADQPVLGAQPAAPQSAVPAPLGRGPDGPRVPETVRRQLPGAAAHEFTAPLEAAAPRMPDPPVRPSSRRRVAVAGLRNSRGLRRGIVLMTILGPCRAIDPYPNRSEPR
jgi:hypothetical protein